MTPADDLGAGVMRLNCGTAGVESQVWLLSISQTRLIPDEGAIAWLLPEPRKTHQSF